MSNRKKIKPPKKPNKSGHSTLADHRQQGKVFTSPMNTLPMTDVPWLRDVFPSMLWSCAVLSSHGLGRGTVVIGEVLERLSPFLDADTDDDGPTVGVVLDGTLQAFEAIPEDHRSEALAVLKVDGLYEEAFPWLLVRALSKYEHVPGNWILAGWQGNEQVVRAEAPEGFMTRVVIDSWHGQSDVATRAKMLYSRAYMYAGRIQIPPHISFMDLLPRYPDGLSDADRQTVESLMRAMFVGMWGGIKAEGPDTVPPRWAAEFWRQNWSLYACSTREPAPAEGDAETPTAGHDAEPPWQGAQKEWEALLATIEDRFYSAHAKADPDLYTPDRNEVLTGITNRHLRSTQAMIRHPGLWSAEHGAGIIRSLIEGRIVQKWLIHKNDSDLFAKFKAYGRGHLKLHVLHLREYNDSLPEPVEGLEETIASMEDLLNRDLMEEFQDISVEASFTKANTRDMAQAVGLIRDYRLVFAPMSANVHSEWIALEQYALVPCRNPLHRGHRIPNRDNRILIGAEVVDLALSIIDAMVEDYCEAL